MADDDDAGEVAASDDPTAPGPRRTTYTPPTAGDGAVHDDDALADALAAEFARISASGPIPVVPPAQYESASLDADGLAEAPADEALPAESANQPAWEPVAWDAAGRRRAQVWEAPAPEPSRAESARD